MGIWDRVTGHAKAQFLDVIQWLEDDSDTIVWRHPIYDQAITDQSKVVVREGQAAVFIAEGKLSEVFGPGTYTLDTPNSPIVSFFRTIAYGMDNPFKGDILFVSTRQFTENRWGTQNPFMMRDAEFGPVRLRAFGTWSFRVVDPAMFIQQIVGTDGRFERDEITGQIKQRVVSAFIAAVGKAKIPVLDLAAHYMDLGDDIRQAMNPEFQGEYGLTLTDFTIGNISLPPEVEKALDTRSRMGILGDLNAYTKLKAAEAIGDAARNPGMGGMGAGLGVGMGVGHAMGGTMAGAMAGGGSFDPQTGLRGGGSGGPPPVPGAETWHYSGPTGQAQLPTGQVLQRIAGDRAGQHLVWRAGFDGWKSWKDVPELAGQLPPPLQAPPPVAARYHYSGPSGQTELTAAEIAQQIEAAPDANHHVWRKGFDGWQPAREVPDIASLITAPPADDGPPPPPGDDGPPPPPGDDGPPPPPA